MNNAGGPAAGESLLAHDRFSSRHLGREVYRLLDVNRAVEALARIPAAASPLMIEATVPADCVETAGRLTALGFRVIDTGIQLEMPAARLAPSMPPAPPLTWHVRDARPDDRAAVERLSGDTLTTSRFHLDPRIDSRAATQLKRAWAANFFDGWRGDRLLVVEDNGAVRGFLLTLERDGDGVIDLVALDPSVRGTGALGGLLSEWLNRAPSLTRLIVGTQVSNVRSLKAYERLGFRVSSASYVLHYHA